MLTKLRVKRFKRFDEVEVELGGSVVLVGPNNSGKTSVLQVLALWEAGLRRWSEKRSDKPAPRQRPGVTINRRDLVSLPVATARSLWHGLRVRDVSRTGEGKQRTQNILIEVTVSGVTDDKVWECGFEFDYANEESIYCRPLRSLSGEWMPVPQEAAAVRIAFLPPMSGLVANEVRLDPGAIAVRVGEGRTAEVLRNLCYELHQRSDDSWSSIRDHLERLFGVSLDPPRYVAERGEIAMSYRERGVQLELSAAGRGLHQTLLLLAYLYGHPGSVLLLDEPDAHLEILRQRQIYDLLTQAAAATGSQLLVATHSEILLNEAADRDLVVAFVGKPHRLDDRGSQVAKALKHIGFEQFYQAELKGWVFYLEGATDLAILKALAELLNHPAAALLSAPFVHYVGNKPPLAWDHFFGLREAKRDLVGLAIYDRLSRSVEDQSDLRQVSWARREIENYICFPEVVLAWAEAQGRQEAAGPLFEATHVSKHREVMGSCLDELILPIARKNRDDRWWSEVKASDDFLDRLFELYYSRLGLPNLMRKTDYHRIVRFLDPALIDADVVHKLDLVVEVAARARPRN